MASNRFGKENLTRTGGSKTQFFFRVFGDLVTYIVFLLNFETVGAKTFKVYTEIGGAKSDADSR